MPKKPNGTIIIAEWPRNKSGDLVRISLEKYHGRDVVNMRTWFLDGEGNYRPGKQGLTLDVRNHLSKLAGGTKRAFRRAKKEGIIDE